LPLAARLRDSWLIVRACGETCGLSVRWPLRSCSNRKPIPLSGPGGLLSPNARLGDWFVDCAMARKGGEG